MNDKGIETFLGLFTPTDLANDPLPIKVYRNSINKDEAIGQGVHWAFEYLSQRFCPQPLMYKVLRLFKEEMRKLLPQFPGFGDSRDDTDCQQDQEAPMEPLAFMHSVIKMVDKVIVDIKDVTSLEDLKQRYPDANQSETVDVSKGALKLYPTYVTYHSMKNQRRSMEDKYTVFPFLNEVYDLNTPISYYAVFDGHNGVEAAAYAAAQLHQFFAESLKRDGKVKEAIMEAFSKTDQTFLEKCKADNIKSGSTVVAAVIDQEKLYVAWVGDSQAVLYHDDGKIKSLVCGHKPDRADEKERILQAGGEVIEMGGTWRVNGNLAVSRSLGDGQFKDFVISTPEMVEIPVNEIKGEYLILASDGLWDVMSPQDVQAFVEARIRADSTCDPGEAIVQEAKIRCSSDNISVIAVFFEPLESLKLSIEARHQRNANNPFSDISANNTEQQAKNEVPPFTQDLLRSFVDHEAKNEVPLFTQEPSGSSLHHEAKSEVPPFTDDLLGSFVEPEAKNELPPFSADFLGSSVPHEAKNEVASFTQDLLGNSVDPDTKSEEIQPFTQDLLGSSVDPDAKSEEIQPFTQDLLGSSIDHEAKNEEVQPFTQDLLGSSEDQQVKNEVASFNQDTFGTVVEQHDTILAQGTEENVSSVTLTPTLLAPVTTVSSPPSKAVEKRLEDGSKKVASTKAVTTSKSPSRPTAGVTAKPNNVLKASAPKATTASGLSPKKTVNPAEKSNLRTTTRPKTAGVEKSPEKRLPATTTVQKAAAPPQPRKPAVAPSRQNGVGVKKPELAPASKPPATRGPAPPNRMISKPTHAATKVIAVSATSKPATGTSKPGAVDLKQKTTVPSLKPRVPISTSTKSGIKPNPPGAEGSRPVNNGVAKKTTIGTRPASKVVTNGVPAAAGTTKPVKPTVSRPIVGKSGAPSAPNTKAGVIKHAVPVPKPSSAVEKSEKVTVAPKPADNLTD